ncbi:hypothetical protein V498_04478, partial [Pseudogymnoascus sp. VKM F-4517 (FW-2822)]
LARLNHRISAELADSYIALINALEAPASQMLFELIEALYANNRKTFTDTRAKTPLLEGFSLKDQLLLYKDRLCVNRNTELYTRLIQEAHNQVSVAHLSGRKTYQLLSPKYHWVGMEADCIRFLTPVTYTRLPYATPYDGL